MCRLNDGNVVERSIPILSKCFEVTSASKKAPVGNLILSSAVRRHELGTADNISLAVT